MVKVFFLTRFRCYQTCLYFPFSEGKKKSLVLNIKGKKEKRKGKNKKKEKKKREEKRKK